MSTSLTNDIFRIVLFVLSWVNSFLVAHGKHPLPVIDETQVSWAITFVISVWAMVKESPFKSLFASKPSSEVPVVPSDSSSKAVVVPLTQVAQKAPVAAVDQPAESRAPEAPSEPSETATSAPAPDAPKTN